MSLKDYKGVLTGDQVQELFEIAKKHNFDFTCSKRNRNQLY